MKLPFFVIPALDYTPAPTNAPLKTPSTNGNVDAGIDNWSSWNAGTATVTTDPGDDDQEADETNNVIYFVPKTTTTTTTVEGKPVTTTTVSQYSSVFFDFGPYIIQDELYGYNGHGAGTYRVKFRVRADENFANYKETAVVKKFDAFFNSVGHKSQGNIVNVDGVIHKLPTPTYNSGAGGSIIMTDQWQWISFDIPVSQSLLDSLKLLKYSTDYYKTFAYQFGLRLDGSGSSRPYGKNENFGYYIDDLSIQFLEQTGVKLEVNTDLDSAKNYFSRTPAKLTASMKDENGIINKYYTVYNTSNKPVTILMQFQGGSDYKDSNGNYTYRGWDDLHGANDELYSYTVKIPAYAKHTFELKAYVNEDDLVKFKYQTNELKALNITDTYGYCAPENVYLRFQINNGSAVSEGDVIYVESNNNDRNDPLFTSDWLNTYTAIYNINKLYKDIDAYPDYSVENKLTGANLEIGSSLTVNYFATVRDGITNPVLRVTRNSDVKLVEGVIQPDGTYKFAYKGINAQCMGDNIKAELLFGDALIAWQNDYSVKTYANNQYAETDSEALKQLLNDMLIYGAAVQNYLGYKTDALATAGLDWTPVSKDYVVPTYTREATQVKDQPYRVSAVGLYISNVNKIYFKLGFNDVENVTITLTKNGKEVDYMLEGNLVYTEEILATGYGDDFTLTIKNGETVVSTVSYDVNAYIFAKGESTAPVGDLVRAMNNYGMSAKAYN